MLKKENRLTSPAAFNATYKNRNTVSSDFIVLYAGRLKSNKNCPTRVGFVVSKKIHKRAAKRNRIKRLMRENIRLMFSENKADIINNYQSLIFSAKSEITDKNISQIQNTMEYLLKKLANKKV